MLSFESGELSRCNDKPDRLAKFLKLRKSGSYNMAWGHAFKTGKQIPSFKNVMLLT